MNKKLIKPILLIALLSIILELFFFNFNALISHTYNKNVNYNVYYDEAFTKQNDESYVLNSNNEYATIEIYNIEGDIKNIFIDFDISTSKDNETAFVEYYIKDEGYNGYYYNEINYKLPLTKYAYGSHYRNIDGSGQVTGILLKIYNDNECNLKIKNISLNETKPIQFSAFRLLFIIIVITLILFIFKYKIGLNTPFFSLTNRTQKILITTLIIISILSSFFLGTINKDATSTKSEGFYSSHYINLTNSLLDGKINIDGFDNKLSSLSNPYDLHERMDNIDENILSTYWDYSYYNNKFYVYFGIGPAILYFVPYKLLTGNNFASYRANIISFIIFSISFLFLIIKMLSKHYRNVSTTMFITIFMFSVLTSGALSLMTVSSFYTVPILFSLAFGILGLTLWLYSINDNKINKCLIVFGSISMAITLSGRPQIILLALLGLLIYPDYIKDKKNNILEFILAILPFIIIGIVIGYYNYIRFDSPFDFGASYNITTNDMTRRDFSLNRIGLGLFAYLFEPYKINTIFPFVESVNLSSAYTGMITYEYTYGGLFAINPLTLLPILLPFIKNKNKRLTNAVIILILSGLTIILFDTQYAGILDRYYSDFSIFFVLASLITILILINNRTTNNNLFALIMIGFMLFAISFYALRIFGTADYQSLKLCNPNLYYKLQYIFQFWL